MAAFTHGMNPDEVDALGNELKKEAEAIRTIIGNVNSRIASTTWEGPDAQTFKNQWWPEHRTHLNQVASDIDGFGQSALNNASEQRDVSSR